VVDMPVMKKAEGFGSVESDDPFSLEKSKKKKKKGTKN
jgi:hypothetical protein